MIDGETLMGEGEGEITIRDKKPLVNPKKIKKNIKTKKVKNNTEDKMLPRSSPLHVSITPSSVIPECLYQESILLKANDKGYSKRQKWWLKSS